MLLHQQHTLMASGRHWADPSIITSSIFMSKGNLFLGMGRGKIGDIVLYRKNGEQAARTRNRAPKNPKSNGQLYQRAIMATIMQAYSAGKAIFDHSFQNRSVGAKNMNEFMSRNLKMLRAEIAAGSTTASVVAPGTIMPVPNRYIVSAGNFQQTPFGLALNTVVPTGEVAHIETPAAQQDETVAAYMQRVGLLEGDIYTIVCFGADDADADPYAGDPTDGWEGCQLYGGFAFLRLTVKAVDALTLTQAAASATLLDVFNIEATNTTQSYFDEAALAGCPFSVQELFGVDEYPYKQGAIGTIRSRNDSGERSNTQLQYIGETAWGIRKDYILKVWSANGQTLGDSTLILEGGNLDGSTRSSGSVTPDTYRVEIIQENNMESRNYGNNIAFLIKSDGKKYLIAKTAIQNGTVYMDTFSAFGNSQAKTLPLPAGYLCPAGWESWPGATIEAAIAARNEGAFDEDKIEGVVSPETVRQLVAGSDFIQSVKYKITSDTTAQMVLQTIGGKLFKLGANSSDDIVGAYFIEADQKWEVEFAPTPAAAQDFHIMSDVEDALTLDELPYSGAFSAVWQQEANLYKIYGCSTRVSIGTTSPMELTGSDIIA